jgi:hypothetical protein
MRFRLVAVCVFSSLLAFAQQEAPSPPPSSDHTESITTIPSEAPASAEGRLPKLDLTPDAEGKLSPQQMQELFRLVAEKDLENEKRQRDYTYIERDVQKNLNGKGDTKSTEIKTYEVLEIGGEQVQRLIQKDDKPLDAKDAAKEEKKKRSVSKGANS